MGLTSDSSGHKILNKEFNLKLNKEIPVLALAGNPNTGKSTIFNGLTGLKQHTGNWPGKTVTRAQGTFYFKNKKFQLVDLPGTYSLLANSTEEKIARDFICFARPDVTIILTDATNLERNLNLVLQIIELTNNVIVCLNFMDEAIRKNIDIDINGLKKDLQTPVIPTVAREQKGFKKLKEKIYKIVRREIKINPEVISYSPEIEKAVKKIKIILNSYYTDLEKYVNLRWLALRLLEGNTDILSTINKYYGNDIKISNYKEIESEVLTNGIR
ncbi:MAG: FeoB small GTPase domain-containing protein [Bacillota bacterium]